MAIIRLSFSAVSVDACRRRALSWISVEIMPLRSASFSLPEAIQHQAPIPVGCSVIFRARDVGASTPCMSVLPSPSDVRPLPSASHMRGHTLHDCAPIPVGCSAAAVRDFYARPHSVWMCAHPHRMFGPFRARGQVTVLPVNVFTKICVPPRRRPTSALWTISDCCNRKAYGHHPTVFQRRLR